MATRWTAHRAGPQPFDPADDRNFRLEGSSLKSGWRIRVTSKMAGTGRSYWVQDGQIYHVLCDTYPPPTDQAQFIIGCQVKRIEPCLREAIFKSIEECSVAGSFTTYTR